MVQVYELNFNSGSSAEETVAKNATLPTQHRPRDGAAGGRSHGRRGLQRHCGCRFAVLLGIPDLFWLRSQYLYGFQKWNGWRVRTVSRDCRHVLAAVALLFWVAELFWLRSHSFSGMHRTNGYRLTAAGFARFVWVAGSGWLLIADHPWVAFFCWLRAHSFTGLQARLGCGSQPLLGVQSSFGCGRTLYWGVLMVWLAVRKP